MSHGTTSLWGGYYEYLQYLYPPCKRETGRVKRVSAQRAINATSCIHYRY